MKGSSTAPPHTHMAVHLCTGYHCPPCPPTPTTCVPMAGAVPGVVLIPEELRLLLQLHLLLRHIISAGQTVQADIPLQAGGRP